MLRWPTLLALLQCEHRRPDSVLADALRLLDTGSAAVVATPLLLEFPRALTRHLCVEDELLTPFLGAGPDPDAAAAMMVREHAEIAAQLELIEDCLRGTVAGTEDAALLERGALLAE